MHTQKTVGQRIKWLREGRGMKQAELARLIGIKPQSLGGIELGKSKAPSASTLLRLAAVLDANPDWIITGKGSHELSATPGGTSAELAAIYETLAPELQAALLAAAKSLKK